MKKCSKKSRLTEHPVESQSLSIANCCVGNTGGYELELMHLTGLHKKSNADSEGNSGEGTKADGEEKFLDSSSDLKDKTSTPGNDKKKPRPSPKKKKIVDEPAEILILSSDEDEEDNKSKKTEQQRPMPTVLSKEPVYAPSQISEEEMAGGVKGGGLTEDLMADLQPGLYTTLQCRTVRVGSHKVAPKERVLISAKGIKLVIASPKNEIVTIQIPIKEILKALIHFGKQLPVIFLYASPSMGSQIRASLGMEVKSGPFYDPASSTDETHKRITLLLDKLSEENKIALHNIFREPKVLEELSEKEANDILVRASPVEIQNAILKPTDAVRKIMVFPPPPEKGGIALNNQDYACLGEDQFLNDVIIDFYLKYLLLKVLSPEDRNRTHVFSTFFYKRLTTKPKTARKNDPENDPKLTAAERRHMRVKGWTKQVNLFEKDFIIVPINEHSHWFLAIICFPGLTGPVLFSDNTPVEQETVTKKSQIQIGNTTITHIVKSEGNPINVDPDSGSDRDEAEGDQDDLHPSSDEESEQTEEDAPPTAVQIPLLAPVEPPTPPPSTKDVKSSTPKRKPIKEPIKQPCILIFDSLAGASRIRVVATLRDYLKIEYKKKMGKDREFNKDTIKGAIPKVPQQNNFTDCGLYVLQYVESFFQDPLHDFKLPLKYLQDWFPEEIVSCKRQDLANLIRSIMEDQGINAEEMNLPMLTFSNSNTTGDDTSRLEEDEDEEDDEEEELNEEEEEELLKRRVEMGEFDNDEEEDMDLGEEEEEEELEIGEIPRAHLRARLIRRQMQMAEEAELDSSFEQIESDEATSKIRLCDYDESESDYDENQILEAHAVTGEDGKTRITLKPVVDDGDFCSETDHLSFPERRKNVPLAELQDFESQMPCSIVDKNVDGRVSEADMIITEDDEEEESDMEISQTTKLKSIIVQDLNNLSSDRRKIQPLQKLVKDKKPSEVTDIIKKLVNDKNITVSRREDESKQSVFKKQLDSKRLKMKDCDKIEETRKFNSSACASKISAGTGSKRTHQTLKSVRIQKKNERSEVANKRQKVDER